MRTKASEVCAREALEVNTAWGHCCHLSCVVTFLLQARSHDSKVLPVVALISKIESRFLWLFSAEPEPPGYMLEQARKFSSASS